jgi:hypothetical protein
MSPESIQPGDAKRLGYADAETQFVLSASANHLLKVVITSDRAKSISDILESESSIGK